MSRNKISAVENLIDEFRKLPGIGPKSAKRIVYFLLKKSGEDIENFSRALTDLKDKVKFCSECFNISEDDRCPICSDLSRNTKIICIVEKISDVAVIEETGQFAGIYHVLGGLLSPIENIGPEEIRIPKLIERIKTFGIKEVVLALNPTVEGDSTATYMNKVLKQFDLKITKLASGLPVGGDIEYADQVTLGRALMGRTEL
ncbi:MAG TPA: recombination protein RecR [Actinobacteria bacterium]|jgi:recombination protein RecR|nr:recombination protein RecR [Actinomycetota bacterium]